MSNLTKRQEELRSSLEHGDRGKVAKKLLMKRRELAMVLEGEKEDERVWKAIEGLLEDRNSQNYREDKENEELKKCVEVSDELTSSKSCTIASLEGSINTDKKLNSQTSLNIEGLQKEVQDLTNQIGILKRQHSNCEEHIARLKLERNDLQQQLNKRYNYLSYNLIEALLSIPNTDLQVKLLQEIKQQFLA